MQLRQHRESHQRNHDWRTDQERPELGRPQAIAEQAAEQEEGDAVQHCVDEVQVHEMPGQEPPGLRERHGAAVLQHIAQGQELRRGDEHHDERQSDCSIQSHGRMMSPGLASGAHYMNPHKPVAHAFIAAIAILGAGIARAQAPAVDPAAIQAVMEEAKARLKLTPEQEAQLKPIVQDRNQKLKAIRDKYAGDNPQREASHVQGSTAGR